MKTVHLVNAWQFHGGGGITTFYRALLDHAQAAGERMVIVAPGEKDNCERQGSTTIYSVKSPASFVNAKYRMIMPNAWPGVNRRVREILELEKPDLIDVCDKYSLHYVAGLIRRGLLKSIPRPLLIATSCERMDENMSYYLSKSALARRFCRWYLKWIYFGFFDHHITVSAHTAEELREAARGHAVTRGVWVMPMGVASSRFSPRLRTAGARRQLLLRADANDSSRLLLYAGRLVPEKNLPLLVEAFAELLRRNGHDYRLIIAGDGILRPSLEAECQRRFGGAVAFFGHLSPDRLPELLANCDAFVHPNPSEPFGIAPLEAMASGTPLVGCNSGGLLSYASGQNAWLSDATAAAMAGSVESVFTDDEVRLDRVTAALETAQNLDWSAVAARFRQLYADFVAGVATGAAFESTPGNWIGSEEPVVRTRAAGAGD